MKKKILTVLFLLTMTLTACGGSSDNPTQETAEEQEAKEPTDLTGTWKSEDNNGSYMEAVISEDSMEINWIFDGGKTKSIYWAGTYIAPTEFVEEYTWTSERDKEKTDSALLASTEDTKDFFYSNEIISYEASAMGTTTTVELSKE